MDAARFIGAYDARGRTDEGFTVDVIERIIAAYAVLLDELGLSLGRIVIGWDQRASSLAFAHAAGRVLRTAGWRVAYAGIIPTPVLYHAVYTKRFNAGIMITASHLPEAYNGVKFVHAGRKALPGELVRLRELVTRSVRPGERSGGSEEEADLITPYVDDLITRLKPALPSWRIIVDTGNGTAGPVLRRILERLSADAVILYEEPLPGAPHHLADPSKEETLHDLREEALRLGVPGFALDGDADRIGIVDEHGRHRPADMLLAALAKALVEEKQIPSERRKIVVDVKTSSYVEEYLAPFDVRVVEERTGHVFIEKRLREEQAFLAGEVSGHVFIREGWYGFDDAIAAFFTILRILSGTRMPVSAWIPENPYLVDGGRIPQENARAVVEHAKNVFKEDARVVKLSLLDGVKAYYPDGWILVRASNTEPVLAWRAEARTRETLESFKKILEELVREVS